jgi:hypothetical protein
LSCEDVDARIVSLSEAYEAAEAELAAARQDTARRDDALAFYADPLTYEESVVPHPTQYATGQVPIEFDKGAIARAALAAADTDTPTPTPKETR